jgi:hypothetical protein
MPFSVAIFVRRFNRIGDMMRKIFVSATVMTALCSLAISVTPALGLEFEGEAGSSKTNSTTAQIIHLGTSSRWVECSKVTMKASVKAGAFTKLTTTLEEYKGCSYNREMVSESVETTATCTIVLESADLVELVEEEFGEGRAKFGCTLEFEGTSHNGCTVEIEGSGGVAEPEYVWTNLDGESGHYESLIQLKLKNLDYRIIPSKAGAVCKSSIVGTSTNGEYDGSIPIQYVTIFPEF